MELRKRKSPPVKKIVGPHRAEKNNTNAELTPRTAIEIEATASSGNRATLEQENASLRQELEEMKKLVQRYEENSRRKSSRHVVTASPAAKRSPPPPALPSLPVLAHPTILEQPPGAPSSVVNHRWRASQSPREGEMTPTDAPHHRKHPLTPQDDDVTDNHSATSSIVSNLNSPRMVKSPNQVLSSKFKDSSVFHPDDDVESPRPCYLVGQENVSLLQNDNFQQPMMDAVISVAPSWEDNKGNHDDDDGVEEMDFGRMILDRAGWLVGLLVLQSMSSFIIQRNEGLLQKHLVLVRFLTMLVGAGGNAGNQASVRVIRGLAIGSIKMNAVKPFLMNEFIVGLCLSVILGVAGCLRAAVFMTPFSETFAITASLFMIVMISVVLGATLPLGMKLAGIDPAHSSTTIQVLMDILGVTITVTVSALVLDSPVGLWLGFKNTV